MSYLTQSKLAADPSIAQRVTACAALEGLKGPANWTQERMWVLSAQPGWVDAYKAAGANPGANESAITDEMILEALRSLRAADTPPPPPETSTSPAE